MKTDNFNDNNKTDEDFNKNIINNIKNNNEKIFTIFEDNLDEYKYLENKILLNYYKMYAETRIRESIINDVLLQYKFQLIEYSYPLIQLIFKIRMNTKSLVPGNENELLKYFKETKEKEACMIDTKNNPQINAIFLYRFEIICDNYFIKVLKDIGNIGENQSKKHLQVAIDQFYAQKEVYSLNNTCNIYCIAFIRRYLKYYVDLLMDEQKSGKFTERETINDILFHKTIKRIETIKYYVLKLIFYKLKNWEKFLSYFKEKNNSFGFNYDCLRIEYEKDESLSEIPILLFDKIDGKEKDKDNKKYKEINDDILFYNYHINKNTFNESFIKNNLYNLLSNIFILLLSTDNSDNFKDIKNNYELLLSSTLGCLKELNTNEKALSFINSIFDIKGDFKEKIAPKIGIKIDSNYESKKNKVIILLYSLRFIFPILLNSEDNKNNEGFYHKLLTDMKIIKKCYIPGIFTCKDLKTNLYCEEGKVREMNNITYRFLILIFYSFLFYWSAQDSSAGNYSKKYLPENMTYFEIIEENWELIQKSLGELDIRIFFNLVYEDVLRKFNSCKILKEERETILFEKEINDIINNKINDAELINSYNKHNDDLINLNPRIPKNIILEEIFT